ncbi:MAG: hypothetical protein RI925_62 [Pseudomonadota bacterium]|jgi:TOMM system kinase/cyclase fusion protein
MKAPTLANMPLPASLNSPTATPVSVPGYTLESLLGTGSYGVVFLATDDKNQQKVAIKIARVDDDARRIERFQRETVLCGRLRHPSIVQLLGDGMSGPFVYGVFEYVPGITLKQLLQQEGALEAVEAGWLMMQVLDALACAHQLGIVHRDLKPENIMIATYGVVRHAKVLDFGISTLVPDFRDPHFKNITHADECLGTPTYSAPEQLRGEAPCTQSDLYAWGLIFLECLTGRPAFEGASTADIFYQKLVPQEIMLPKGVASHPVASLLRKALRKKRDERSQSAQVLLHELSRIRLDDLVDVSLPTPAQAASTLLPTVVSQPVREEKRQVTLLFCGVSVWLPPQDDDPEAVDFEQQESLQRTLSQAFQEAALQRGGSLIGNLGHQFCVMFGYPKSTEGDARLAATIATELMSLARRRASDAELCRVGGQLEVRVGLHTGMVVIANHEVSPGNTLNIAMQIETAAMPGEICVSESFRQLLRGFAEFDAAGQVRIPSTPLVIPCFRLLIDTLKPIEEVAGSDSWHTRCIGRSRELRELLRSWRHARVGQGRSWMLRGEAGVGKSCLSETLRRHIVRKGGRTLCARCFPEYENSALAPLLALLRQQVLESGPADPESQIARLTSTLQDAGCDVDRVLPIFCTWLALPFGHREPSPVAPVLQKRLLIESAVQWLLYLSHQAPLLLVVEDLHWADSASLEWLQHLSDSLGKQRIVLLQTCRPGWGLSPGADTRLLEIGRLKSAEAAAMVRHLFAPQRLASTVVDNIVLRTDGVPLFIQELSHMLRETSLVEQDGVWNFKDSTHLDRIPITLRESLNNRFDQIGPARDILQLAATIGREVDAGLLYTCVIDAHGKNLDISLNVLVEAGLLALADGGARYIFRHALIRDAAYDGMLKSQQKRRHETVALAMEKIYPNQAEESPGALAHHFARAEHYAQAIPLGLAQLRQTQHRSLNDETIAYAQQVDGWIQHLSGQAKLEARLELNGYVTQALMNKHGWAHPQVAEKIALSEVILAQNISAELRLQHLWTTLTYHHVASNRAEVMQLAQAMLLQAQITDDSHAHVSAKLWLGLAHYSEGWFDDAERELSAAIAQHDSVLHAEHAARFGLDTLVWSYATRALVRWGQGYGQPACDDAHVAVAHARQLAHVPSLGIALLYLALFDQGRNDAVATQAVCEELIELAQRYGLPAFLGYAQIIRSWTVGEVAEADAGVEALWRIGCRYGQTSYRAFAAHSLARAGDFDGALARLDDCLALVEVLSERRHLAELYWDKANYLWARGASLVEILAAATAAAECAHAGGKRRIEAQALYLINQLDPDFCVGAAERLRDLLAQWPELSPWAD